MRGRGSRDGSRPTFPNGSLYVRAPDTLTYIRNVRPVLNRATPSADGFSVDRNDARYKNVNVDKRFLKIARSSFIYFYNNFL